MHSLTMSFANSSFLKDKERIRPCHRGLFFTLPIPIFSATYRRAIRARNNVAEALGGGGGEGEEEGNRGSLLMAGGDDGLGFSDEEIVDHLHRHDSHRQVPHGESPRLNPCQGYTFPKGWTVFASFRAVHLEPLHFKDAILGDGRATTTTPANAFTPFGGGPRLCPGYKLGRVIISVFLHHFITRFSWVPAEHDKLIFFPTTRMQKRYPIDLSRHKNGRTVG